MSLADSTDHERQPELADLSHRLGYTFADHSLLQLAVTHRSFCAENEGHAPNERLEFLGDSVLGLVITVELFERYPEQPEGELAKVRAGVVNGSALADAAATLDIGAAMLLGRGEDASGGRSKPSILADAMEAVIGAVYLDGGFDPARRLVVDALGQLLVATEAAGPGASDFKTRLQERAAQLGFGPPRYDVAAEGPDHDKRFHATVVIGDQRRGQGSGTSKKQAEQAAAAIAFDTIDAPQGQTTLSEDQHA